VGRTSALDADTGAVLARTVTWLAPRMRLQGTQLAASFTAVATIRGAEHRS
jgi:hypothetical protein